MIENDIMSAEEQIKLPKNINENNNNNSYKFHYNYNSPNYHKDLNQIPYEFNYNDDLKQFNTSPKLCHHHPNFKKLDTIIPHHHCHLPKHNHHTPQCRSHSSSPSPIKNISQPLYFRTFYNSNLNGPYENNLINNNDKVGNSQIFFSDELSNDFSNNNNNNNNNALQKLNENNDIDNINKNGENHLKAMDFDDYMSKLVYNKYNKMKQFNESYYLRKQFGDETNYTNINNTFNDESINNEFNIMRKNLEKKYKLYNLITKYDNLDLNNNNIDENLDKNEENEEEINDKKNKEKKNKNKLKKNKKNKHRKNISPSSSDNEEYFDSSPEKNNFIKDEKNNKNIIQKTFNENIGQKNSSYVSSTFNHVKDKDNINNNESNISNSNLLEYLKKENDELKNINNNYKQTLDTLFYFLNNIFHKYRKGQGENQINNLFDLSKDINSTENLSKKLINLESLINDNDKNINKFKTNSLLMMTKENSFQLPDLTKLEKFNDLIEGINEKCFSFKNDDDNFIERYKKDKNDINNNKIRNNNIIKIIPEINKEKEFINKINNQIDNDNDKDKCVACLLGCNVSKRGYSPMRFNPNNKKEERIDDSGDLFDKYNEKKEKNKSKSKNKRNINKTSKSKESSLDNTSGNNRKNKSMTKQKKIWK